MEDWMKKKKASTPLRIEAVITENSVRELVQTIQHEILKSLTDGLQKMHEAFVSRYFKTE